MAKEKQKLTKRAKTPTVLQMEAVECGAASLAMVMGYHGKFLALEELRLACGVSRDGSKAVNLLKAARKYGFNAKGYRKDPDDLKNMPCPMIIHWNFNHFLVLEGFHKDKVYLNDPAVGPKVVSYEEFDQAFTGVALTFEPGPEFQKEGEKGNIIGALRKRLSGSEIALVYVVLVGLMLVVPGLIMPTLIRIFVDNVLLAGMNNWFGPLLIGMLLIAVLKAGLTWLQQYHLLRMETRLALSTSSKFFWHVLRLPVEFFTQRYAGEVGNRVQMNNRVAMMLSGQLATTVLDLIVIVFYLVLLLQYNVVLTLIGVAIVSLNVAFLKYISRLRVDQNQKLLQERGKLFGMSMNGLQIIETLKANGSETDFFAKWAGYQAKMLNSEQELGVSTQLLSAVPPFLNALNNVAILAIGGLYVLKGQMSIGMLVAFQSLMTSFTEPVNRLVTLGSTLQEVEGDMKRLDDVLKYPIDKQFAEQRDLAEDASLRLAGYVELKNVTFGYSRLESALIENFSLSLKPGHRVALVGGSGSGKSTVAKLVSGLYQPWSGEIIFDGKPANSIPRAVLNNSLAVVDQDINLFEGTIRENLTLWDDTTPEEDVITAAKDACIHDDITARPSGYDYLVQEGGHNFSGGQRQRLEIARALAGKPTVLVLDEATSALDPKTEKAVDDSFRRHGCTCIIVAHRLSTIRDCDEIIVLERGKVVQRGTHEEMKSAEGPYASLIAAQ